MEDKKRVTILVTIALILAVTAITLNITDSNEIPTTQPSGETQSQPSGGEVGIDIQPSPVEDKLTEEEVQA